MKKLTTFAVSWLAALPLMAQWTQPEPPAMQDALPTTEAAYLYNADADAFYLGANDWSTRASVSATRGYLVTLSEYTKAATDTWDGVSYQIMTAIEYGSPAGQTLPTYITGWNNIWVDAGSSNTDDKAWTFNKQSDGTYLIGLSEQNSSFIPSEGYENAYLGLIPEKGDTRVYLCEEGTGSYDYTACQMRWYFVSATDYTAYITAKKQYNAAVLLGEDLEKARVSHPTADLSTVETIYNNTASTADELTAARATLADILAAVSTPDAPADMTAAYLANPSYDDNDNTGWSGTSPAFQTYGNAEFYEKTYDAYQSVTVPEGVYRVSLNAYYRAGSATDDALAQTALQEEGDASAQTALLYASSSPLSLRATPLPFASTGASTEALGSSTMQNSYGYIPNDMQTAAAYMEAGQYAATTLLTAVGEDGALTVGLKNDVKISSGWTLFDDWKLECLGDGDDAYVYLKTDYLSQATDYQAQVEATSLEYYNHAAYDNYLAARATLDAATTKAAIPAAMQACISAADSMEAGVEAYAAYAAKLQEAREFLDEKGESLMGEGMETLSDYVDMEDGPSDEFPQFPNGGAIYVLNNGLLSTTEIAEETTFLQELIDNAMATGMTDGTDCTDLIKNAHFTEEGVWSKEGLPEWPVGTDEYKMAQGYSILFDVSQTLSGLQEGLYELSLYDFFRPANIGSSDYTTDAYRAYVYMNDDEALLNLIDNGATEAQSASDDVALGDGTNYVPNSLSGAATAFEAGRYKQTLYGIVTDGTLKIGVRNDLRYEGCWAVFSDFQLVFRAKNADVLASVISSTIPNAQALLNNKCGQQELSDLQSAISAAQDATEDAYDALVSLKQAMAKVDTCTENYVLLQEAIANGTQTLTDYAGESSDELTTLQTLVDEAQAAYTAGSYTSDEASGQAAAVNAAVVAVKIGGDSTEEKDVSSLIINNTFDPDRGSKADGTIEGWTTSSMNGYKENTVSYNRAGIDLYQTLNGLPAGHYRLTVHTYYRAGYAEEDYQLWSSDPTQSHLTELYAQVTGGDRYSATVMNLCEGAQAEAVNDSKCDQLSNGLYVPNGTSASVTWFNAGYYLNTLEFDVAEDGTDVTIGLKKDEVLENDYEVVGEWNLYYTPATTVKDVSSLIVNNTFDPDRGSKSDGTIEGWTTSAMNGYKENTVSYNRAGIDLYQTIYGLPAGDYKVTVHTYYRAGYAEEDYQLWSSDPTKSHLTELYAQVEDGERYSTSVMNLCEGAQAEAVNDSKCDQLSNGLYVPNGTTATVTWFNAGYYLNELEFNVPTDNGTVTIGLKKDEVVENDYEVVGEWNLYYYGQSTAIDRLSTTPSAPSAVGSASPVEWYALSGMRIAAPQKGINIVKTSDGRTLKVLVK